MRGSPCINVEPLVQFAVMMGLLWGRVWRLELIAMNKAGIPSVDVIRAATLNSAKVIGVDDEYGSVEPGKVAEFLSTE